MAITFITSGAAQSAGGTDDPSVTLNTTGADFLVAVIASPLAFNPTDNKGNTWSTAALYNSSGFTGAIRIAYCKNAVTGSNHIISAAVDGAMCVAAFSGVSVDASHETPSGATAVGVSTIQPGSVTPSENGCLLITGLNSDAGPLATVNSGFTRTGSTGGSNGNQTASLAYKIQTTAGAENPTWTGTGTDDMRAAIVAFKSEPLGRRVQDTATGTDGRSFAGAAEIGETATVTDEAVAATSALLADTATATDTVNAQLVIIASDAATAADGRSLVGSTSKSETATATETASGGVPQPPTTDTAHVADSATFALFAIQADGATASDGLNIGTNFQLVADTAQTTETARGGAEANAHDTATVTDAGGLDSAPLVLAVADGANATDANDKLISLGESFILTEPLPYGT